jgi:hypothetical protein
MQLRSIFAENLNFSRSFAIIGGGCSQIIQP